MDRAKRDAFFERLKVPVYLVWLRDGGTCHLCGDWVHPADASRDHVRPRSRGGKTTWANIRLAHRQCNSWRGSASLTRVRLPYG